MDEAWEEKRSCDVKVKECDIRIGQYEEYLSRPEIAQKAQRLKLLRQEIENIEKQEKDLGEKRIRKDQILKNLMEAEPQKKARLQELIAEETILRKFFEEELALKLVVERQTRSLAECAREAVRLLRDSDKNREYGDMLQSLIQVYQRHNGSLAIMGPRWRNALKRQENGLARGQNSSLCVRESVWCLRGMGKGYFWKNFTRL